MIDRESLTSPEAVLKGWLAGSLGAAGLVIWWLFPLLIPAIIIFLDSVIVVKKVVNIVTTIIFTIIGAVIAALAALADALPAYAVLVAAITCLVYTKRFWWKKLRAAIRYSKTAR